MTKFLRMASLVATVTGLAITATPAMAVTATTDADARVEILKGLTLSSSQNLDLGTVVLSGSGTWTGAIVAIDRDGNFDCDGGSSTKVTCSGSPVEASYDVTGSAGYDVDIASGTVTLTNTNGDTLDLTPDHDATVTLDSTGAYTFGVGGSVSVDYNTPDGVYTGTFAVTADYQ